MRLEEYDAKYTIKYKPNDVDTLREGLKEYEKRIINGSGFEDDYCVVHFCCDEDISLDDFKEHAVIYDYLKHKSLYSSVDSEHDEIMEWTTTETLFFAYALKYEALIGDIASVLTSIVKYIRKINDSSEMWLTCESPFAIEPLRLLAEVEPSYGWLLAGFFVANWDDEHMNMPLDMLGNWATNKGICEATLKAYCYCDNYLARERMIGYDTWDMIQVSDKIDVEFNLISYFRDDPERFNQFIEMLIERFNHQSYIDTEDNYFNAEKIIRDRILEMMFIVEPFDVYEDDFDVDNYLTKTFINRPCDEVIEDVTEILNEKVVISEVELNKKDEEHDIDEDEDFNSEEDNDEDEIQSFEDCLEHISDEAFWSGIDYNMLDKCYAYVNSNRPSVIKELEDEQLIERRHNYDYAFLLLSYTIYKDKNACIKDELHNIILEFIDKNILDHILCTISCEGKWSEYSEYLNVKDNEYDNDYQRGYKEEVMKGYKLFEPVKTYILHGENEDSTDTYYKKYLNIEDNSKIAPKQERYSLYDKLHEECLTLSCTLYFLCDDELSNNRDIYLRVIRLLMKTAPIKMISSIEKIVPKLSITNDIESYLTALEEMKYLGMPDEIYYTYQLISLCKKFDLKNVEDINHYPFSEAEAQYLRLLQLLLDKNKIAINKIHPMALILSSVEYIQSLLRKGRDYLSNQDMMNIYNNCPKEIFKFYNVQNGIDNLLRECLTSDIKEKLYSLPEFVFNIANRNKIKTKKMTIYGYKHEEEETIDFVNTYQNKILDDSANDKEIFKDFETNEFPWVIIDRQKDKHIVIYGQDIINHYYTQLQNKKYDKFMSFKVGFIDNCPDYIYDMFSRFRDMDYRSACIRNIFEYTINQRSYNDIKMILSCGVDEYELFKKSKSSDLDVRSVVMNGSLDLRTKAINIIGSIDERDLSPIEFDDSFEFIKMMFNNGVEREVIFRYVMYLENKDIIEWVAMRVDCSNFIDSLKIDEILYFLNNVSHYPQYHPLIINMRKHSSAKIKKYIKTVIDQYNLLNSNESSFNIIDFGMYQMGGQAKDSKKENVSKISNAPSCINQTTELQVKHGDYIGIRFTASDTSLSPNVFVHKVVVKQPVMKEGKKKYSKYNWEQNGYSSSEIFAGIYFDPNEEIIEGKYTISVYDLSKLCVAEIVFNIKK